MQKLYVENRLVTAPKQLQPPFNQDDGIGIAGDYHMVVKNCIVDLSNIPIKEQDESASTTWGSSSEFTNCIIRGAAKLFLIGSGDKRMMEKEKGKNVFLNNCILEHFGRRGPEVQDGMICEMHGCLVQYWSDPTQYNVRGFGAWAHKSGEIYALDTIFLPTPRLNIPLKQRFLDRILHFSQAIRDEGFFRGIFSKKTYIPGYKRALFSTDKGYVEARNCWFHPNCYTDSNINPMPKYEFEKRMMDLDKMRKELYGLLG